MLWPRPQSLSTIVRLVSALIPLWPRLHTWPAVCLPCVRRVSALCPLIRFGPASKPCLCPPCALCPPRVRFGRASKPSPCVFKSCAPLVSFSCVSTMCPFFVRHVPALCQLRSTMCLRISTLSARGLLWGRAVASWSKILVSIAQPTAFILHARWSVSLAFISAPQIRRLQARPMPPKTVSGLWWYNFFK